MEQTLTSCTPRGGRYYDQTVLNVDCLLRNRHRSRWLMFVDLDEYVQISSRFSYSARAMLANFPDHWAALRVKRIRYLVAPQVRARVKPTRPICASG